MNSALNSLKPLLAALALALLCSACTDHGPVGLFSKELFNKVIPPAKLGFDSASNVSFTTSSGGAGSSAAFALFVTVNLANKGNSSTYGPIQVDFSSPDPNMNFILIPPQANAEAYGAVDGKEVPADPAKQLVLLRGYKSGGQDVVADNSNSFEFWYAHSGPYTLAGHNVEVDMLITDSFGNSWTSQFMLYIVT